MKLQTAEFVFSDHKVVFDGALICVLERVGDDWEMIHSRKNEWTSRGRETASVMGRKWKPRVTDAADVLNFALREKP